LGAGDLVMLAIGAVIGAGIFSSLGTAAAGETLADGTVVRYGAGPALVLSFILLGAVCALAALCYAELSSMIPQAGSAYAYSYATLGEIVAWIVGWALVLEYAVGNVAVAIAWSGYFVSLLSGFGIELPGWITHGYWVVKSSGDPGVRSLLETAPRIAGVPILINLPAFGIVVAITMLLLQGVKESMRVNTVMVVIKLLVLTLFVVVGSMNIDPENYKPFAPNGFRGIHQGAAIVFFAYIGFDAISTAAEETKNPQRNLPIGILGGLGICTVIYVIVGFVATGLVPYTELAASDPLARALTLAGSTTASWIVSRRRGLDGGCTARVPVRPAAHLLRDGARRLLPRFAAKLHPGHATPHVTTIITGVAVAAGALLANDAATYDLTNIGTLAASPSSASVCSCCACASLTGSARFRVPFIWVVSLLGAGPASSSCRASAERVDRVRGLDGDRARASTSRTATATPCCAIPPAPRQHSSPRH
jgi:APA family basic amino acid/polyamine antiporter